MKPITDEDVKKYIKELKAIADEEGEAPEEDVPENELIDTGAENLVVFLKKKGKGK